MINLRSELVHVSSVPRERVAVVELPLPYRRRHHRQTHEPQLLDGSRPNGPNDHNTLVSVLDTHVDDPRQTQTNIFGLFICGSTAVLAGRMVIL